MAEQGRVYKNDKDVWKPYNDEFQQSLKEAKNVASQSDKEKWKNTNNERLLEEVEVGLEALYNNEGFRYLIKTHQLEFFIKIEEMENQV